MVDFYELLNQDRILSEIHEEKVMDFQVDDIRRMLGAVITKWLPKDFDSLIVEGVEQMSYFDIIGLQEGNLPPASLKTARGIVDLQGIYLDPKTTKRKRIVIDWKTTSNKDFSTEWRQRLLDSWQGRCYAYDTGADEVWYRGITYDGTCTEVIKRVTPEEKQAVIPQFSMIWDMRASLVNSQNFWWPQNMPHACGAYGRECRYKSDCQKRNMPLLEIHEKDLSYSGADKFLLCPERYRRDNFGEREGDTEETAVGRAFHRGVAEVYRQVFNVPE